MLWIILLYRKCSHQAIHYSSFGTFFTNLCCSFFFFFVFQRKSERLIFISENASKVCGGSPCLQATWCCLHSHFAQWFHSFLSLMWSLAPWKQVSLSQLLCASSSTSPATMPVPTAESWGWGVGGVGGGGWGTSWITSLHSLTSNSETNSTAVSQKALPPESNNIQKIGIYAHVRDWLQLVRDWLQLVRHSRLSDFRAISPITSLFVCVDHHEQTPRNLTTPLRTWHNIQLHTYIRTCAYTHRREKIL